jgi:hypothetical protein
MWKFRNQDMEIWDGIFTYTNENATLFRRMKQRLLCLYMGISFPISNSDSGLSRRGDTSGIARRELLVL